jgi:hypothetical protein
MLQVRFSLTSSPVFSRADTVTDSERFYDSVLDLFEDTEEIKEVNDLQTWWNRCVLHYLSNLLSLYVDGLKSDIPKLYVITTHGL